VSYIVSLRKLEDRERGYYAQRFYYGPSDQRFVRLSAVDKLRQDSKGKRDLLVRSKVYIPVIEGWQKVRPLQGAITKRVPGATFHQFHGVSVIELRPTKQGKKALRQVFEVLVERLKPEPEYWRLYHTLAWLRFDDGDPEGAKKIAERLKKLDSAGVVREGNAILRQIKYRQNYAKEQRKKAAGK
jgi:hypothetical protein